MHEIDWAIVAGYALIPLIISFYFMRKASADQESYLLAGRNLPWYVIGFSACATYTSSGSSFAFQAPDCHVYWSTRFRAGSGRK